MKGIVDLGEFGSSGARVERRLDKEYLRISTSYGGFSCRKSGSA
jgi:hypothetical protein